jgi:pimeloyl-ACP methyl ester carboxylesterase
MKSSGIPAISARHGPSLNCRSRARYQAEFPHADWVILDEVGHCPQLGAPLEAAQLILGFTAAA